MRLGSFKANKKLNSPMSRGRKFKVCYEPLLEALGWSEKDFALEEAISQVYHDDSIEAFEVTMANLHYKSRRGKVHLNRLLGVQTPFLFIPNRGNVTVVTGYDDKFIYLFDSVSEKKIKISPCRVSGIGYWYHRESSIPKDSLNYPLTYWFRRVFSRMSQFGKYVIGLSLGISILVVLAPLIVLLAFAQIDASSDSKDLYMVAVGIVIYLISVTGFRLIRYLMLSYIAARIGNIVGVQTLRRILYLPPSYTETAPLGSQVAQVKDFESMSQFLTSSAASALIEAPFGIIVIIAIFSIGGVLGFIPIAAGVVLVLFSSVILQRDKVYAEKASRAGTKRHEFIVDTISGFRAIKVNGLERTWDERFTEISLTSTLAGLEASKGPAFLNAVSHTVISLSGLLTMLVGTELILNSQLTPGGLMASLLLTWRVLGWLRSAFVAAGQISRVRRIGRQLDRLMGMSIERPVFDNPGTAARKLSGLVEFDRVSLRYSVDAHPALLGVSFVVKPAETMLIVGHAGCGKASVLKLILALYYPQTGRVLIDNLNSQQIDPIRHRRRVAYMPARHTLFKGTLRQNLRMVDPTASQEAIEMALAESSLLQDIGKLPDGLDTVYTGAWGQFSNSFMRRFSLAQMFLKQSDLWLLDDPGFGLNSVDKRQLVATLDAVRGSFTIVIASEDPDFLAAADKVMWLADGRVKQIGTTEELMRAMGS